MNPIFISHIDRANLLDSVYVLSSLIGIITISFFIFILSLRPKIGGEPKPRSSPGPDILSRDTTDTLRGVAIALLIFGHLSQQLTEGVLSFRITGNAAVCIFLMLSGAVQAKKYGMSSLGTVYVLKRFRRIFPPLWLTLILFYFLNYLLLGIKPNKTILVLNFFGILWPGLPNSPAWFITYILFLYTIYFIATKLPLTNSIKIFLLLLLSYTPIFWIQAFHLDSGYLEIWMQYSLIFPVGVCLGLYRNDAFRIMKSFHDLHPILFPIVLVSSILNYYHGTGVDRITHFVNSTYYLHAVYATINYLSFILAFVMFCYLVEIFGLQYRLLSYLGRYSFEIFLLHMPFMASYDIFLFRQPLFFYFFAYTVFVLFLAIMLKSLSDLIWVKRVRVG